jgi:hypothetical protein|nr:MAG TPA: hypothetical protein [Caudoviricetes sp.]
MPGNNSFEFKTFRDIEQAYRIKYQYFKLYCQSNSILVNDCDSLEPYNTYHKS